jgi:hypothetical protein
MNACDWEETKYMALQKFLYVAANSNDWKGQIDSFEYIVGKAKAWGRNFIVKSPIARHSNPEELVRELVKQVEEVYKGNR